MIKYKVKTNKGYTRIYSKWQSAKLDYGTWCRKWNDSTDKQRPNWVRLYILENDDAEWLIMEELTHEFNDN